MIGQGKKNELDNFLTGQMSSKREGVGNLSNLQPSIRYHSPRQQQANLYNGIFPVKQNNIDNRNISPSKLHAKNKPIMSPSNVKIGLMGVDRQKNNVKNKTEQYNNQAPMVNIKSNLPQQIKQQNNSNQSYNNINNNNNKNNYKSNNNNNKNKSKQNQYSNTQQRLINRVNNINLSCINHSNRSAQFISCMNDEQVYYCGRCAAQLASQGFKVQRMGENKNNSNTNKTHEIPYLPEYEGNPIYQQIIQFLQVINSLQTDMQSNINKFMGLQNHYDEQIKLTQNFYLVLLQIIQQMKNDHLRDLYAQCQQNTQIADIQNDHLQDSINQINSIRNDIEINMEELVAQYNGNNKDNNIDEFRKCFDYYKQKIEIIKLGSQGQFGALKQVTSYRSDVLEKKINLFEEQLISLWNDQHQNGSQKQQFKYEQCRDQFINNNCLNNIINKNNMGTAGKNEGKSAFRNLFGDNQNMIGNQTSPQFKII